MPHLKEIRTKSLPIFGKIGEKNIIFGVFNLDNQS